MPNERSCAHTQTQARSLTLSLAPSRERSLSLSLSVAGARVNNRRRHGRPRASLYLGPFELSHSDISSGVGASPRTAGRWFFFFWRFFFVFFFFLLYLRFVLFCTFVCVCVCVCRFVCVFALFVSCVCLFVINSSVSHRTRSQFSVRPRCPHETRELHALTAGTPHRFHGRTRSYVHAVWFARRPLHSYRRSRRGPTSRRAANSGAARLTTRELDEGPGAVSALRDGRPFSPLGLDGLCHAGESRGQTRRRWRSFDGIGRFGWNQHSSGLDSAFGVLNFFFVNNGTANRARARPVVRPFDYGRRHCAGRDA